MPRSSPVIETTQRQEGSALRPALPSNPRPARALLRVAVSCALAGLIGGVPAPDAWPAAARDKRQVSENQNPPDRNRAPFTQAEDEIAVVPGMPDARFWADSEAAFERAVSSRGAWLLLSAGGGDGAFGAGLLTGLTESGKRPEYAVMTGVSAGAMIATLAFAGTHRDRDLRENFTTISSADVFEVGSTGESLLDTWPLRKLIEKRVTAELLAEIAAQHRQGRRLFVLTSNLDAERAVAWNMGAIAAHGGERALKLFRDVLLSSSSVPGLFPPVLIEVEANGRRFEEMHADGAMGSPIYFGPETLLSDANGASLPATSLTVIVNGKLTPEFLMAERNLISVVGRSVSMGLKLATRAVIARLHTAAQNQGIGFHLAFVDPGVAAPSRGAFDPDYMRALFDHGVQHGRSATPFASGAPPLSAATPRRDLTVGSGARPR
jgi:hypothetical protein